MNELGKVQEEITLYIGRQHGCFRTGLRVNNNHRYLHDGRARQRRTIELSAELCSGPVANGAIVWRAVLVMELAACEGE